MIKNAGLLGTTIQRYCGHVGDKVTHSQYPDFTATDTLRPKPISGEAIAGIAMINPPRAARGTKCP